MPCHLVILSLCFRHASQVLASVYIAHPGPKPGQNVTMTSGIVKRMAARGGVIEHLLAQGSRHLRKLGIFFATLSG
jgi:hypothetical protein